MKNRVNNASISQLNFAVTYRCNSRCAHCNIWRRRPRGELTLAEIDRKIIRSSLLSSLKSVGITGGEPFIRSDLHDVCARFWSEQPDLFIGIATNGMAGLNIADRAIRLRDCSYGDRLGLSISIDGAEEEHDRQRGVPGAFRTTMETITLLKKGGVPTCISLTITPHNCRSIVAVYRLARDLGVGFIMRFAQNSFYYGNDQTEFHWDAETLQVASSGVDVVIREILATYDLSQPILDPYIYFLTRAVEHRRKNARLTPCLSGIHSVFIDSFGMVYPCIMLDKAIGSIKEAGLSELFLSPAFDRARAGIAREECHCWTECETIHSLEKMPELLTWDPEELLPMYGLGVKKIGDVRHGYRLHGCDTIK